MSAHTIINLRLVILVGPSGGGKTEVVKWLLSLTDLIYRLLISNTTRPPRENDLPGEYRYRSLRTFRRWKQYGLCSWEPIKVSGYSYASYQKDLDEAMQDKDRIYLAILTPEIARKVFELFPGKVLPIWIDVPEEVLKNRLRSRGDRPDDIEKRLVENAQWKTRRDANPLPYYEVSNVGPVYLAASAINRLIHYHLNRAA